MTIDTHPPPKIPFSIENAFTDRLEGGNPAAIVHLPSLPVLPDATLQAIAANFNQPIAVFITPLAHSETVAPSASGAKMARFSIRWFTPELETSLCGHGTLAAAAAVFRGKDGADAGELTEIRFEATSGKYLVARKLEEGRIEIQLDSELSEELSVEEDIELRGILAKALGANVTVRYTGRGAGDLKNYALIEVDTLELKNVKVNTNALLKSPFLVHVVVAPSSIPGVTFESRMFAPRAGVAEDPVCGSANALATPYWMAANNISESDVVHAKQVSARGGDLRIVWDAGEGKIKLAGQTRGVCRGELYI